MRKPKTKDGEGGYFAIHSWLVRTYGLPLKCSWCGVEGKKLGSKKGKWSIEHALKPGYTHKHDINHYEPLCMSCHRKQDYENNPLMQENFRKGWIMRKKKYGLNKIDPKTGRFIKQ